MQLADRCLPRERHAERHGPLLLLAEAETAPDGEPFEREEAFALPVLVLGLHARDQFEDDVLDLRDRASASQPHLSGQ